MKANTFRVLIAITFGIAVPTTLSQNLLVNGSFELPADVGTVNGYAYFPGGSSAIPGWTTILNGVEYGDISRANVGTGFAYRGVVQDGSFCIDLAPWAYVGGGIKQTFDTLPGTNYEVSFFMGTAAFSGTEGTGHCLATAANATNSFASTNTGPFFQWVARSFIFTAISTNTTLTFSTSDNPIRHYVAIDNVTVVSQGSPLTVELSGFYPGIRINGRIGRSYVLEYKVSATSTNWHQLQYVTLQTSSQFVFDTTSPNRTNRFYRAVELSE